MGCQQLLKLPDFKKLILCQAQDVEGLFFGDEAALDSETFICDILPAKVSVFCRQKLVVLLFKVLSHLGKSLRLSKWAYVYCLIRFID